VVFGLSVEQPPEKKIKIIFKFKPPPPPPVQKKKEKMDFGLFTENGPN